MSAVPAVPPKTILVIDDDFDQAGNAHARQMQLKLEEEFATHEMQSNRRYRLIFVQGSDPKSGRFSADRICGHVRECASEASLVLLDVMFGTQRELGMEILARLVPEFPALPIVLMTSVPKRSLLVHAMDAGAVDYVVKPVGIASLSRTLDRFVGVEPEHWLIGQSSAFLQAVEVVARVAEGGRSAGFIMGESGTGKELLARYLHRHGPRASKPFTVLHIPGMNSELLESRLFGHARGAFTGATADQPGEFVKGDGGVVFLDEISNIAPDIQARLLRVTESGEVARAGDGKVSRVNVQMVSATNANILRQVKDGAFRRDLWNRLSTMPLVLPPLRERKDDIPFLLRHLFRVESLARRRPLPTGIPLAVLSSVAQHRWAGNVRALRSLVQRCFDFSEGEPDETTFSRAFAASTEDAASTDVAERSTSYRWGTIAEGDGDPKFRLQQIRLDELSLLMEALRVTRAPLNGSFNRARAGAWLTGRDSASTNVFDRRFQQIWSDLVPESRSHAIELWGEQLGGLLSKDGVK